MVSLRRLLFPVVALSVFTAGSAFGEEAASGTTTPQLKLTVTPAATGLWTFRVQNASDTPMRIAADARLLSLEITPPSGVAIDLKKAKRPAAPPKCILPADARPTTDEGHELVIPPNRAWSSTFDPLFYCFGPRERAALVAQATVKARFGWAAPITKAKTTAAPPFAAAPIGASIGKLSPVKELEADPFTLTDAVTLVPQPPAPSSSPTPGTAAPPPEPKVFLVLPETMDAARGSELGTTLSLVNESDRAITTVFRPDMVQLFITGPNGVVGCGSPRSIGSPMRELFITVAPRGRTSIGILFTETCTDRTFDAPGLYRMSARVDTTNVSGRTIEVKSWDDVASTKTPMLLRIRQPFKPTASPRPTLD